MSHSVNQLIKLHQRKYCFSLVGLLCLITAHLIGCGKPAEIKVEPSLLAKPPWIKQLPAPKQDELYFVGMSTAADSLEAGKEMALKSAMSEISSFIGTKIKSVHQSYTTETNRDLSIQLHSESAALIKGAKVIDAYHEKTTRTEKNFTLEKYDVYLLVGFFQEEARQELKRQRKENLKQVAIASAYYQQGLAYKKKNDFLNAHQLFKQGKSTLQQLGERIDVGVEEEESTRTLSLNLETALRQSRATLLKINIDVQINGPAPSKSPFTAALGQAFSDHRFTMTHQDPTFKITGNLTLSEGNYVMNNYVYYAEGRLSAESIADKQIFATYLFQVKGFHRKKKQAALNALTEAGVEAGHALSKTLKEKIGLTTALPK